MYKMKWVLKTLAMWGTDLHVQNITLTAQSFGSVWTELWAQENGLACFLPSKLFTWDVECRTTNQYRF